MAHTFTHDLVDYECRDHIAVLTLNRPEKLNAFSDDLVRHLVQALRRFDADPEAYAGIICGSGRAFSSGADVSQRQLRSREELELLGGPQGDGAHAVDVLTKSVNWKPVVAAAHGYVMGMAVGLALECELIVAEAGTKFQVTETPRGLGSSKYWALLNFRGAAAFGTEVSLTGRFFSAEEAFEAGVINRVAPPGKLMEIARELAADMAAVPPLSVRAIVRTRRWAIEKLEREAEMEVAALKLHLTEDFREAALANRERRPPAPFRGR